LADADAVAVVQVARRDVRDGRAACVVCLDPRRFHPPLGIVGVCRALAQRPGVKHCPRTHRLADLRRPVVLIPGIAVGIGSGQIVQNLGFEPVVGVVAVRDRLINRAVTLLVDGLLDTVRGQVEGVLGNEVLGIPEAIVAEVVTLLDQASQFIVEPVNGGLLALVVGLDGLRPLAVGIIPTLLSKFFVFLLGTQQRTRVEAPERIPIPTKRQQA